MKLLSACALLVWGVAILFVVPIEVGAEKTGQPVSIRITNFPIGLVTTPNIYVYVENGSTEACEGRLELVGPAGWTFEPAQVDVAVPAGETFRTMFTVYNARLNKENAFSFEAKIVPKKAGQEIITTKQTLRTCSAPFGRPSIDLSDGGDVVESLDVTGPHLELKPESVMQRWEDAFPITWTVQQHKTTLRAFWNRRNLSLLIGVEEDHWIPDGDALVDAVQISLASPIDSKQTGENKFEFLVRNVDNKATLVELCSPAQLPNPNSRIDPKTLVAVEESEVSIIRSGRVTWYAVSIPWKSVPSIRAGEGREFYLSFLIHDPDGTGLRNFADEAGFVQNYPKAWTPWKGGSLDNKGTRDHRVHWGMCSSKM